MKWHLNRFERIVGVFLIITVLVVIIAVIMIQKWWESFEEFNYYSSEFKTKTGLAIDMGVYFKENGWEVGRVTNFELNERNFIDVDFKIRKEYCDRIREDSVVNVNSVMGAIGSLQITIGHVSSPVENGRKIPSSEFPEGQAILEKREYKDTPPDQITTILTNITELTNMLTDEHGEIRSILRNIEAITRQIRYGEGILPSLWNDPAIPNKVGRLMDNVDLILKDIDDVVLIQNENINKLINEDVQRLLTKIEQNLDIYTLEFYAILDNVRIMVDNSTGVINNLINESGEKVEVLLNALSNQALRTLNDLTTLLNAILRDIALNTDPMLRNIVNQVFNTANEITQQISHLIVGVSTDITQLTHNLVILTDEVTEMLGDLNQDIAELLDTINDVAIEAQDVLNQLGDFVGGSGTASPTGPTTMPRRQSSERLVPE